jgi:hypothetical protein
MNTVWLMWVGLTVGSFAVLETWALVSRQKGGTLSERLREWLGINPVGRAVNPPDTGGDHGRTLRRRSRDSNAAVEDPLQAA